MIDYNVSKLLQITSSSSLPTITVPANPRRVSIRFSGFVIGDAVNAQNNPLGLFTWVEVYIDEVLDSNWLMNLTKEKSTVILADEFETTLIQRRFILRPFLPAGIETANVSARVSYTEHVVWEEQVQPAEVTTSGENSQASNSDNVNTVVRNTAKHRRKRK